MLRKSLFFDFLSRHKPPSFEDFIADSVENEHYIEWNGFALPNDYGNAEFEYSEIRNNCAIFDVSPLRKIAVRGFGAGAFLDRLLTRPVSHLSGMRATYVVFCENNGALKDDAILYQFASDDYLLMPSDVDHTPYFGSVCRRFEIDAVNFTECTDSWAGLAIQGPKSATVLHKMGFSGVEQLKPFDVQGFEMTGGSIRISRMGFTADLGYECWFEPELVNELMMGIQSVRASMGIGIPGYGLDALQACRLEGGFIVAGWDCSTELDPQPGFERSPFELGLGWLVRLNASDFVGRDALREQKKNGQNFVLRSFTIDQQIQLDDGQELYAGPDQSDASIGSVNCSSWSWGMQQLIGNASIKTVHSSVEVAWLVCEGESFRVRLQRGPLIDLARRTQVPAQIDQ